MLDFLSSSSFTVCRASLLHSVIDLGRFCAIFFVNSNQAHKRVLLITSHSIHLVFLTCIWKDTAYNAERYGMTWQVKTSSTNNQNCYGIFILEAMFGQILTVHDKEANGPDLFGLKQTCVYLFCSTHPHLAWTKSSSLKWCRSTYQVFLVRHSS